MIELAIHTSTPLQGGAATGLLPLVSIIALGTVVGEAGTPAAFLIGAACPVAALVLLPVLMRREAAR